MEKKLNFTDQALNQISIITKDQDKKFFRITVQGGGCSGFKYNFGFDAKTNDDDISLDDCALFNTPASEEIENSNFFNCSYVLEISSQGVSDELTSERDFKTFKGFPVNVELNQKNSKIKFLNGLLYEKSKDYLAINIKGKIKKIPFDEVLKISLCTLKD